MKDNFDKSVEEVFEWSNKVLLDSCADKEDELVEKYGEEDGAFMCPFYVAMLDLAYVNTRKGWTKEELLKDIGNYIDNNE